ncbi:UNVERIFIED_CONTAM: hypothetical protein K2H54_060154 [Gekko kuhli]
MEDEEGSMALNFQSAARGQNRNNSKLPVEDTLVKQPSRNQITARIGCVVMFLLIGALIAHRIWDNATCKLCPENWFLYEEKCYWISKEKGSWKKGKEDCTARSSQLLVMPKQKDMAFIQSINEEMQLLWIGLQTTFPEQKWIWVDGSPLDDKRSQELGPVESNSCGMLNGNDIISEACGTVTTWVCETEALSISNDKM